MILCFAALVKVLKICAKPKVYNKALCGALIKTLDEYYGNILEVDDSLVSRLLSCDVNLSPVNVILPARNIPVEKISKGMEQYVIPLIDENMVVLTILALKSIALSTVKSNNAKIGLMSRYDLSIKKSFVLADFLADIFIFTVTEIENKAGKSTISHITETYVKDFEQHQDSIRIESEEKVETQELSITLEESGFEAVFRKVNHGETLALKNKSRLNLYYLDISDSSFDYMALNEYLLDSVGMYVFSRTQIKEFEDKKRTRSIGAKALRLMKANGNPNEKGTGNELGEMLLFAFMEDGLHAPKILSKVEINTNAKQFNSKSDCVHLLKRKINGELSYQLVFGASSIHGRIQDGIDSAFESLAAIKNGRTRERQMVDSTLFNHTYDHETTERLKQILVPNKQRASAPDMAFGVFIGYSIGVNADNNDAFRTMAVEKMSSDIKAAVPYIEKKVTELNLGTHSYYFYFLPLNDAESDKKKIMEELLGGIG